MDFINITYNILLSILGLLGCYVIYLYFIKKGRNKTPFAYIKYSFYILIVPTTLIYLYQSEEVRMLISLIYNTATFIHTNNMYVILLVVFMLYYTRDAPAQEIKIVSKKEMKDLIDKDIITTLWIIK